MYVVVWFSYFECSFCRESRVFDTKDEATKWALKKDGTVYGMNPRYEFTVEWKAVPDAK
jgi:hypothetical protein